MSEKQTNDNFLFIRITRRYREISLIFFVAMFFISGVGAFFVLTSLNSNIHVLNERDLKHSLFSANLMLKQYLRHHETVAEQIQSRTQIRKKLIAWNQGKISLKEVQTFSNPRLNDALRGCAPRCGVLRYDIKNRLVAFAGITVKVEGVDFQISEKRILNPFLADGQTFLPVYSPIIDAKSGRVGTDIVIFKTENMKNDILASAGEKETGRLYIGSIEEGEFRVFLSGRMSESGKGNTDDSLDFTKKNLEIISHLKEGEMRSLDRSEQVVRVFRTETAPWFLVLSVNRSELESLFHRQMYLIITAIILLLFVSGISIYAITRPLFSKIRSDIRLDEEISRLSLELLNLEPGDDDFYHKILGSALSLTQSKFGFVGYVDPRTGYFIAPTLTRNIWDQCEVENKNIVFKDFKGLWGYVLREKKSIYSNDLSKHPYSGGTPEGHVPISNFASVPVLYRDELVGNIAVANSVKKYTEQDIASLERLATLYALILQKMRIMEEKDLISQVAVQNSKMALIGEMMSAIAHQWKQPLSVIGNSSAEIEDIVEFENSDKEGLLRAGKKIDEQVQLMLKIMQDFRNFFKPDPEKIEFIACETVVDVVQMFSRQFSENNIEIVLHDHEHFSAQGNPNEFKQVILNLLVNSKDAILEHKVSEGRIDCRFEIKENEGIIRISDNGGGVSADLMPDKLFEPYVTTKGEHGTGIGLSVARLIIEKHMDGKIAVNNIQDGAEFTVMLPLVRSGFPVKEES